MTGEQTDGTNTPRQMVDDSGDISLTASYTPWGDTLAVEGKGNFRFGSLGSIMDAATGLLYVGNGQYYDPATGRFLTRDAKPNQANPYVPWKSDPAGAVIAPLALLALVYGNKKKHGRWDNLVILLVISGAVGMSLSACNPVSPQPPNQSPTAPTLPSPTSTPPPAETQPSSTPRPAASSTVSVSLSPTITCTVTYTFTPTPSFTPMPHKPFRPPGLLLDDENVWVTYEKLWQKQNDWWWRENEIKSFTPLDYLDRLLQFELISWRTALKDEILIEMAVGNFCFWNHRDSNWKQVGDCNSNPTDIDIFVYIDKRHLLTSEGDGKHYEVVGENFSPWLMWAINLAEKPGENTMHNIKFDQGFKTPNVRWLDWRNKNWTEGNTIDDPLVEWGLNVPGFYPTYYDNVNKKVSHDRIGRGTNQIGVNSEFSYAFTFCQLVYYTEQQPKGGIDSSAFCDHPARWFK